MASSKAKWNYSEAHTVADRLQLGHLAPFLLRLCQRLIVEDVLIIPTPLNKGRTNDRSKSGVEQERGSLITAKGLDVTVTMIEVCFSMEN